MDCIQWFYSPILEYRLVYEELVNLFHKVLLGSAVEGWNEGFLTKRNCVMA